VLDRPGSKTEWCIIKKGAEGALLVSKDRVGSSSGGGGSGGDGTSSWSEGAASISDELQHFHQEALKVDVRDTGGQKKDKNKRDSTVWRSISQEEQGNIQVSAATAANASASACSSFCFAPAHSCPGSCVRLNHPCASSVQWVAATALLRQWF
jgi:hypothetical protein